MKYVIIAVLSVLVVFALLESIFSKRLFVKKLASDNAYIKLDNLFIERYEMMDGLFSNTEDAAVSEIMQERQKCIDSTTETERSGHDKRMAELIEKYRESNKDKNLDSLDDVGSRIDTAYSDYNSITNDYNNFRKKLLVRPVGKFLGLSEKPIL